MKKILAGCLLATTLAAHEYGYLGYFFVDPDRPIHVAGRYRQIGSAEFEKHQRGHVDYADAYAAVYYTHFLNSENSLSWGVGYDYLKFDWEKNPRFSQKHFNYATASLGYVSTTLDRWRWLVNGGFTVEAEDFNFGQTAVYHGMLWGRYHFSNCCGFHVGALGYYGVKNGYALPIFGLDWKWGSNWIASFIFPVNISLNYAFNDNWSAEVAYSGFGGPYKYPRRANDGKGRFHDPIFETYSSGVDLNLLYQFDHLLKVTLGVGYNGGGWILIKNHENDHGKYYHYNGAPYAQGTVAMTF